MDDLKENVDAAVEKCLFRDNQVCFRLRGPTRRGAAQVTITDCAVFDAQVGVRMEDGLQNLKIHRLGIGSGVHRKIHMVGSGTFPGFENKGQYQAESFEAFRRGGVK